MTIPKSIQGDYHHWHNFLDAKGNFSREDSEKHTKEQCATGVRCGLLMAVKMDLPHEEREVRGAAAVFQDSRRQDDWLDVGHGQRAADYYRAYCRTHPLFFDERAYLVMAFHDRDDALGEAALAEQEDGVLLYRIFKDADALDRFRLGPRGLDARYLRTAEAKSLYQYAEQVVKQKNTVPLGNLGK